MTRQARGALGAFCFVAVVLLLGVNARADTLHVPGQYATIQAAIDAAQPGDEVVVADDTYTGPGNRNLDLGGKAITVRSASGDPSLCIIDCEGEGRGFYFHSGETADSIVEGFTVRDGYDELVGGGGVFCTSSSPTLLHCIITENGTSNGGGGVYCASASPILAYCTISENGAGGGGGLYCDGSSPVLDYCDIVNNRAAVGGGLYCEGGSAPVMTHCSINENESSFNGGGMYCRTGSAPAFVDCLISKNEAADGGGAYCTASDATFCNCVVHRNRVIGSGAGVLCTGGAATLTQCVIVGNGIPYGGYGVGVGVACFTSSMTLKHCILAYGSGAVFEVQGYGFYCSNSDVTMTNCIVWQNLRGSISTYSSNLVVSYCDIDGGWSGVGNIDADPLFADPHGPDGHTDTWEDNDFRPSAGSPCIDAGDNAGVPPDTFDMDGDEDTTELLPLDLWGEPRFVDDPATPDTGSGTPPVVDMGPYEFQPPPFVLGDTDCSGVADMEDVEPFVLALLDPAAYELQYAGCSILRADVNEDESIDGLDIDAFTVLLTAE